MKRFKVFGTMIVAAWGFTSLAQVHMPDPGGGGSCYLEVPRDACTDMGVPPSDFGCGVLRLSNPACPFITSSSSMGMNGTTPFTDTCSWKYQLWNDEFYYCMQIGGIFSVTVHCTSATGGLCTPGGGGGGWE